MNLLDVELRRYARDLELDRYAAAVFVDNQGTTTQLTEKLRAAGIRTELDDRSEKVNAKIREAQLAKIPYMLVVGEQERQAGTVALRDRIDGDLGSKPLAEVLDLLRSEVQKRCIRQTSSASAGLNDQSARFGE